MTQQMYVYIPSESNLWTVGFYGPAGKWNPESDHTSPERAAERVHWLNGGWKAWENRGTSEADAVKALVGE